MITFFISCGDKQVIFKAVQKTDRGVKTFRIYEDLEFKFFLNSNLIDSGTVYWVEDTVVLSYSKKSFYQTLIHSEKYVKNNDLLCPVVYVVDSSKRANELRVPFEELDRSNCLSIE
jgi:hypothetical protein